jgi:succinyl-diaminopimelate desuccinylase
MFIASRDMAIRLRFRAMSPFAYIDAHASDLVALLQRLVRIPTVNPPGAHYDEITRLLAAELANAGLKTRRFSVPRDLMKKHLPPGLLNHSRYNVLGKLAARGAKKTLHFNAHYDVVPVSGDWRHGNPFSGTVERGWIYGRGTADMKGSHASLLLALRALKVSGVAPTVNVEVSFTADEETDSELGAGWLVKHAPIRPDYAIVMEGGEGNGICCGHNGVVWLNVIVHGRAAHGSRPEHGINALEKMAALVGALEGYKQSLAKRVFTAPDGTKKTPTINVGGVFASGDGGKINTVPALASFSIDRRVLPIETVAAAERELRTFLKQAAKAIPQCRITVEKVSENHPCFIPPTGPFFNAMADCVTRVRREKSVFRTSYGFNDMHFFAHHLKIPTLGHGPGGDHCHAVDERASVRELVASAKIYAELMTTFTG